MNVLPVTLYGDKVLRKKAVPVTPDDKDLVPFIQKMFVTMDNADGIGLAANQVGSSRNLFVIDISHVKGYEYYKPMVFINPKIVARSEEQVSYEEGCLSVPDIRAEVMRPEKITIQYVDTEFRPLSLDADGLLARVIQHEYDHLQGIFFVERIEEEEQKKLKKRLEKIKKREIETDYPVTEPSK